MRVAPLLLLAASTAFAVEPGQEVPDVALRTSLDKPATIPSFGKLVVVIFYTDADVDSMNDPLADALTDSKIDVNLFEGVGVVNLPDSKAPNFIIRAVLNDKSAQYDSTVLTDPTQAMRKAWSLGDCNDTSVIVVVGVDKKVKYVKRGPIRGEEIKKVVSLVGELVAELKASTAADAGQ